jgi:hypothetical protein
MTPYLLRFVTTAGVRWRQAETVMSSFSKAIVLSVLCSVVGLSCAAAQMPLGQVLQPSTTPASSANAPVDLLKRTTPAGTVLGFLESAQSGNYWLAAQYLQMSAARRQSEGEQLATKLKVVMDSAFTGRLGDASTLPQGSPQEGVGFDHQVLGTMASGDVEAPLELVRVPDPNAGKIWLISSDTLSKFPSSMIRLRRARSSIACRRRS